MVNSLRRKTKIKKQPSLYTEHGPVDSLKMQQCLASPLVVYFSFDVFVLYVPPREDFHAGPSTYQDGICKSEHEQQGGELEREMLSHSLY